MAERVSGEKARSAPKPTEVRERQTVRWGRKGPHPLLLPAPMFSHNRLDPPCVTSLGGGLA
eukprot:12308035-Heterocapsa_arctica.AAC.1